MADSSPTPPVAPPASPWRWVIITLGALVLLLAVYRFHSQPSGEAALISPQSSGFDSGEQLRRLATIPPFALTERSGRQITNRDLAGKIWIADFIYTTCPGPCPLITAEMAKLQAQVANDPQVMQVTFTVDPDTDTPAVLAKYADSYGANPDRWWFLTGPKQPLFDLIQNGFLQIVEDNSGKAPEPGQYKVTHSTYLALVDGSGDLRGVYQSQDPERLNDLLRDIKRLEQEEGK